MTDQIEKKELPTQTKKDTSNKTVKKDVALTTGMISLSVALGFVGAVVGAIIWYGVAAITDIQIGYLAILIGIFVGFGMKFLLKDANSLSMGLVAAGLALFGLLLGNFLLWYIQMPKWTREVLISDYGYSKVETEKISDSEMREEYGFGEYISDDLTDFESTDHNPVISWIFYILAITIGFTRVYDFRNPNRSI